MNIRHLIKAIRKRKPPEQITQLAAPQLPDEFTLTANGMRDIAEKKIERIMVYASENVGLTSPKGGIRSRNFQVEFEPFDTKKRFNEFDGIILFQGCFENVHRETDWKGSEYYILKYDKDELDKRLNETRLLLKQGGYICFVLCRRFVDGDNRIWQNTDLAKIFLNLQSFYREDLSTRTTWIRCVRNEFRRFLEIYGAALATFHTLNKDIEIKPIAMLDSRLTGMIMWDKRFFIPALLPENVEERVSEFFTLLADALVATRRKLVFEVPIWADKLVFPNETSLQEEKTKAIARIEEINVAIDEYKNYKKALIQGDEQLVDTVSDILKRGFGFDINAADEYKEDLKILNSEGEPLIFCEVKGVNRGVQREHINQADSHRERAGLPATFPAILMINTHIKNARNLEEKDKDVPMEQVVHARKNNILIIRTLDILRLLCLKLERNIPKETILVLLCSPGGWLRVRADKWDLIKDPQPVGGDPSANKDSGLGTPQQ
jgi:SAM-dependent methyltransferase